MENKRFHLQLIQQVIDRMARCSFQIRGWSVVLVSAIFALATARQAPDQQFVLLAFFPALVFWGLDAFYLSQERQFRGLYDEVRAREEGDIDFSMDKRAHNKGRNTWVATLPSKTVAPFHGVIVLTILTVKYLLARGGG